MFSGLATRFRAYAERDGRGYPDWAMRYLPVARRLRGQGLAYGRILEVGANECGFARFAHARVFVVDLAVDHLRAARTTGDVVPVLADAAALPFRRDAFDVCVCMDTLEHLPPELRDRAADQMITVSRVTGWVVAGFPAGEGAVRAEEAIRDAYRTFTGRELPWFEEHAARGLPDGAEVAAQFSVPAGNARRVVLRKNTPLWLWRMMWRILMCGWPGRGNAVFQALLRVAAPLLSRIHVGACYRAMVWVEPK